MDKKRILLVENENVTAMDIESELVRLGYEVTASVSSGEEALRAAAEARPDLVLMDIALDGPMSGIEAAAELRKTRGIPVVFLSAHADSETVGLAMTAEPFGFLPKPCGIESMRSTIEVALYKSGTDARLRESEERYRQLVETAMSVILRWDTRGTATFINEYGAALFGYRREELVGKNIMGTIVEETDSVGRDLRTMIEGIVADPEKYCDNENENRTKDGKRLWMQWRNSAVLDGRGNLVEILSLGNDITERKRSENELSRSEAQLKGIVGSIAEGILSVDNKGAVIRYNRHFADMWRIPDQLLEAGDDNALIHFVSGQLLDPDEFLERVRRLYDSSEHSRDTLLFKDGRIFERASSPLMLGASVEGRVWSFRDITSHKSLEDQLSYNNAYLQAIIENEPDCVMLLAPDCSILDMNPAGFSMINETDHEQVMGSRLCGKIDPEYRRAFTEFTESVCGGKPDIFTYTVTDHDGRVRWLESRGTPFRDEMRNRNCLLAVTRDITERKKAEEELSNYRTRLEDLVVQRTEEVGESERKYRHLFELAGDAIIVADSETGLIVDVNQSAEALLNRDRSELIGMHHSALHPPEDAARYREMFRAAGGGKGSSQDRELDEDVYIIGKNGHKIPVEISANRLELAGRNVLVGVFRDLRQRKVQEGAFILLRKAVDAIPLGVTIVDRRGCIVYVNKADADLHGYQQEALIGKQSRVYAPPNRAGEWSIEELLASIDLPKENYTRESENVRRDGGVFPVEISSVPILDNGGEPIGLVSACKDISDRKQAMIALEERERKYRDLYQQFVAVLDVIPDVMMLVTTDLRLTWINKTSDPDLFKTTAMPGARCCEVFKLCAGPGSCPVRRTLEAGESTERQVSMDSGRTLDVRTFPVFDEGGSGAIGHALCVISDVSEKMRLFWETARAKQLASIGELAAGVAHEINNPLNSVINYAQLIMDDNGPESETWRHSERIFKEGCRIESIVKGLLSFARHRPGEKTRCELAPMIDEVLMLLRAPLGKEGITVKMELSPELPAITANRQQIEQVLLNLVNNARYALNKKYAERNEEKIIEIWGKAGSDGAGTMIELSVMDLGCGIPADALTKVMDPFFTTKPVGSGTGLGLSICHGIIHEHGGTINIRSREHFFTKVTVELPVGRSDDGSNG